MTTTLPPSLFLDSRIRRVPPVCNLCNLTMEWYTGESKTREIAGYICPTCEYSIITDIRDKNANDQS